MSMFGMIVAGRLVSTNWEQISPTNVVSEIPDADSVNHLVVFLTGAVPFPDGMGGAVYFCWPPPGGGEQSWQLLGTINNNKPSAIFRISRLKTSDENLNMTNSFMALGGSSRPRTNAMVGISVEPLATIEAQTPAAQTEAVKVSTFMEFGQKMVENLFNFATSFAVSGGEMNMSRSGETFVPFSCLQQWYSNFERRLQHDPNFWKK